MQDRKDRNYKDATIINKEVVLGLLTSTTV